MKKVKKGKYDHPTSCFERHVLKIKMLLENLSSEYEAEIEKERTKRGPYPLFDQPKILALHDKVEKLEAEIAWKDKRIKELEAKLEKDWKV